MHAALALDGAAECWAARRGFFKRPAAGRNLHGLPDGGGLRPPTLGGNHACEENLHVVCSQPLVVDGNVWKKMEEERTHEREREYINDLRR